MAKGTESKTVGECLCNTAKQDAPLYVSIGLTIPLPGKHCNPNRKCHWAVKARAVKAVREAAFMAARDAKYRFAHPLLHVMFFHPYARKRDRDNHIASLKGAVDGLADAGLFENDCQVRWGDVEFLQDPSNPRVQLTIQERLDTPLFTIGEAQCPCPMNKSSDQSPEQSGDSRSMTTPIAEKEPAPRKRRTK